jgi:hypothetical protein
MLRNAAETKVEVTLGASRNPSVEVATKPGRLVLVLPNTHASAELQHVSVNHNGVGRVRIELNSTKPLLTRVVADLDESRLYSLTPRRQKITPTIGPPLRGSESGFVADGSTVSTARPPAFSLRNSSAGVVNSLPEPPPPSAIAPARAEADDETPSTANKAERYERVPEPSLAAPSGEPKPEASPEKPSAVKESSRKAAVTPAEGPFEGALPIPLVTGFMAFQSSFSPGEQHVNPVFDPILLIPLGNKLIVESEFEMNLDVVRSEGQWGPAAVDHSIEYLQLDYMAHPNLTITAGRFLTPFGIYRERIHPLWVRNLQDEPIIFAMNANSANGAMLRGAARLSSDVTLTYATYYSALANWKLMPSDRSVGGRASLFFPNKRLELGASFSRTFGNLRYNMFGMDATWNLKRIPLDIRAEGLHNAALGSGYWVEGAYRLTKLGGNAFLRKSQVVLRGEQYFTPSTISMSNAAADAMSALPDRDTKRIGLGWNYYLTNGIRLNASFGHNFATGEDRNTWGVGVTYRFVAF